MAGTPEDLIAGTVLFQLLLVRLLEDRGVLENGEFLATLEAHMSHISPDRRDSAMYAPIHELIRRLRGPRPAVQPRH